MPKNKEKENSYYERILGADRPTGPSVALNGEQFQSLLNRQSPYGAAFGSSAGGGSGSMLGIQAGRKALKDIAKGYKNFGKKDVKDLYGTLQSQIERGAISSDLAAEEYLNAAKFAGVKNAFSTAETLATKKQGFVDPSKYERYTPFMQLNAEQLLGRNLSDTELKNYTEAFRGMGISKPADVSAAFGNMLLSTPEARSREVVVRKGLFDKQPRFNTNTTTNVIEIS
jgi:hypothetical protein